MNRKSILGLLLFGCVVIAGLFYGVTYMTAQGVNQDSQKNESDNLTNEDKKDTSVEEEPWLTSNPSDNGINISEGTEENKEDPVEEGKLNDSKSADADSENQGEGDVSNDDTAAATGKETEDEIPGTTEVTSIRDQQGNVLKAPDRKLIYDCSQVDYKAYIPEMAYNYNLKTALEIDNPDIDIDASAAILFDSDTKEILFYKNPVEAIFPASTAKLLSVLVALEWCEEDEEVTIGEEVKLIATDSSRAYLNPGQILTVHNLLEGMLLPSGNDAAYAMATYVGRKSLGQPDVKVEDAVTEFVRLMNEKAKKLGAINSCFKTPDGYDAIGQYTTAYDMGLIGIEAAENKTILKICKKSSSRNIFISGEDVTWYNSNALIKKTSGEYLSGCIGLKTGTSTMAGRCLIAAAERNGRKVVSVVMDSSSVGRWDDSQALLEYGLK